VKTAGEIRRPFFCQRKKNGSSHAREIDAAIARQEIERPTLDRFAFKRIGKKGC